MYLADLYVDKGFGNTACPHRHGDKTQLTVVSSIPFSLQ